MSNENESIYVQEMNFLIRKCYVKVYFYIALKILIVVSILAMLVNLFFQVSYLSDDSFAWILCTPLSIFIFSLTFFWAEQQHKHTLEDKLGWKQAIVAHLVDQDSSCVDYDS